MISQDGLCYVRFMGDSLTIRVPGREKKAWQRLDCHERTQRPQEKNGEKSFNAEMQRDAEKRRDANANVGRVMRSD